MSFVYSLDLEWVEYRGVELLTEVGFIVFDGNKTVIPYHYIISETYDLRHHLLRLDKKFNFLFSSRVIPLEEMLKYLQKRLNDPNITLVGHDIENDLNLLREYGMSIPKTLKIRDTQTIAATYYGKRSLQKCLDFYNVSYSKQLLHNGGNDAFYTMRLYLEMLEDSDGSENLKEILVNGKDGICKGEKRSSSTVTIVYQ